jgi:hypothetical protein
VTGAPLLLAWALAAAGAATAPARSSPPAGPAVAPWRLPEGEARWRMELSGVPVGVVSLAIRCDGPACDATFTSRQRLPEETGGAERSRRVSVPVDRAGRATGAAVLLEDGARREVALPLGAVPALLAEVVLVGAVRPGREACAEVAEEGSGAADRACARREPKGSGVLLSRRGARERLVPGPRGFPAEVLLEAQGIRFVLDPGADLPAAPPRLYGATVDGPEDPRDATGFCGAAPDRPGEPVAGLPAPRAEGPSCREKTAAWLRAARGAGLTGRTALGVAWDGGAWRWHAWAEVSLGGRWVAVDPSFGQAPAGGPRFTLATYGDGDEPGRLAAGRRLLACWGRARVEGPPRP